MIIEDLRPQEVRRQPQARVWFVWGVLGDEVEDLMAEGVDGGRVEEGIYTAIIFLTLKIANFYRIYKLKNTLLE